MAILYILQQPELSVRAITVVGTGEAHCGPGTAHALGLIAMTGGGDIPVTCGRETPLAGDHHFPSDSRERVDGALGIAWPKVGKPSALMAPELLRQTLEASPQPVVVVTDGPLTNLGELFQREPKLVAKIRMIYIMGGAFDVPGNVSRVRLRALNKTSEFNLFVDPHAANVVLRSGAPVTLVPLDATNQVPLDTVFYRLLSNYQTTAGAKAVYVMLTQTQAFQQSSFLYDPLTYAIAGDETLATYDTKRVTVVEEEGPEVGRTKVTTDGAEVRVAQRVDAGRFVQTYLSGLNGGRGGRD